MAKFRKKPVEVEAVRWRPGVEHAGVQVEEPGYPCAGQYYVTTIHGQRAYLTAGDWILPEPQEGRFYPCKPDVFAATYEPVEDA